MLGSMDPSKLDLALQQLLEEQRSLRCLRADYAVVTRSRSYGLRMMWLGLKQLFGMQSDRPIVISPQSLPELREAPPRSQAESHLVTSWLGRATHRPLSSEPMVSVIIPAYNHCDVTARCLQSIADTWFESLLVQIIVVDDGSVDETPELLARVPGVDYVRNGTNQGFIRSCNRAATIARGKYLCFLNNDTEVRNAWLDYLVSAAEEDPTIGAVGSKLIYPDGRLQEAGGIIFDDGNGWNYGRLQDPQDARYNFMRDVDYCSGAALLVRADIFRELGGFDEAFVPAYYEDADLCFGVRSLGHRVVYQPRSEVVHYEGITSGTDSSGVKRHQDINRPVFVNKWRLQLSSHAANDPAQVPMAARRLRHGRTILVVDSYVPLYDREAGSDRLFRILKIMRKAKYHVIFLPDNYASMQPYTRELQDMGIEVLHHIPGGLTQDQALEAILPLIDIAWICRPELFEKYAGKIRSGNSATKLIYDTIDLHFVRKQREMKLLGDEDPAAWKECERSEIEAAKVADATLTVSEDERALLRTRGIETVFVVPTLHEAQPRTTDFEGTSGLLFIGGYGHPPNVDAAVWLCTEIMPLVWEALPGITVTLLGNSPPDSVKGLESAFVRVPGYARDLSPYFERSRVFAAPIRFGAGLKGKVGHSLSYGLPVVATTVAAEGFGLEDARDVLIADTASDFARAIVRLYGDAALWGSMSQASLRAIRPFSSAAVGPNVCAMLETLGRTAASPQLHAPT
jgi:GT2 family glycosyltransferase